MSIPCGTIPGFSVGPIPESPWFLSTLCYVDHHNKGVASDGDGNVALAESGCVAFPDWLSVFVPQEGEVFRRFEVDQ